MASKKFETWGVSNAGRNLNRGESLVQNFETGSIRNASLAHGSTCVRTAACRLHEAESCSWFVRSHLPSKFFHFLPP